jgi:beta-lactamase class A
MRGMSHARWGTAVSLSLLLAISGVAATVVTGGGAAADRGASVVVAAASSVQPPSSPVGAQLAWLLGSTANLPLPASEIATHFDTTFLSQAAPAEINSVLAGLGPAGAMRLLGLTDVEPTSLRATVELGPSRYNLALSVDPSGLIEGLLVTPVSDTPASWAELDHQLAASAPHVSFLAARVEPDGACRSVNAISAATPRPLGSMFKLFVLGALANAVRTHRVSWNQTVTVTAGIKVAGSGDLQNDPDGTALTVEQAAIDMISISDNTAADLLLNLVGRAAVERQVRAWSSHPALDIPFLTVSELFALKCDDFPKLADYFLRLGPAGRAAYLRTTVDAVTLAQEVAASAPHDVNSIEWFASADDICRAFVGLAELQREPGLGPIATILSTNNGGIDLASTTWPRVWFKGGSESGVLTLGYLATDTQGETFVVVALTEDPTAAFNEQLAAVRLLAVVAGGFDLAR